MLRTLVAPAQHEAEIRKSRFLARAFPISTEAEVPALLRDCHDPQATHHCWAWRLGQTYRFQDDGEPGGTAGRPILQAIDAQSYDRVLVVVVRWFGGTKLGTGGLIRAYGGTAAECLRGAAGVELRQESRVQCRCDYSELDRVQARLQSAGARIESAEFDGTGVVWGLVVPTEALAEIETLYMDLTRGQGRWQAEDVGT